MSLPQPFDATDLVSGPNPLLGLVPGPLAAFVEVPFVPGSPLQDLEIQRMVDVDGSVAHLLRSRLPDGTLEVWADRSLGADREWVDVDPVLAIAEVSRYEVVEFERLVCELDGPTIEVAVHLTSSDGRRIVFEVSTERPDRTDDIFTPAVPGADLPMLRLLRLRDFWLMDRGRTRIHCSVDGIELEPEPMGGPVGAGRDLWSARVAGTTLVAGFAPACDVGATTQSRFERDGMWFETVLDAAPRVEQGHRLRIESDLGTVTTAVVRHTALADGRVHVDLSRVAQQWFPGFRDLRLLALYGARRARRRSDRLRFSADLAPDGSSTPDNFGWRVER